MGTSLNQINNNLDQTVRVFDAFYSYDENVPGQEYDIVFAFFLSAFKNADAAGSFTTAIFRIAAQSDQSALTILQTFENQTPPEISLSVAYYLNGIRSPATLLGVLSPTTPNSYTARNVRQ